MNGFAGQFGLKCPIDKLMLLDSGQTDECCGDHAHLEMISPTGEIFNRHRGIRYGALYRGFNGSRLNHELETSLPDVDRSVGACGSGTFEFRVDESELNETLVSLLSLGL